jgi:hypothetical protein
MGVTAPDATRSPGGFEGRSHPLTGAKSKIEFAFNETIGSDGAKGNLALNHRIARTRRRALSCRARLRICRPAEGVMRQLGGAFPDRHANVPGCRRNSVTVGVEKIRTTTGPSHGAQSGMAKAYGGTGSAAGFTSRAQ